MKRSLKQKISLTMLEVAKIQKLERLNICRGRTISTQKTNSFKDIHESRNN